MDIATNFFLSIDYAWHVLNLQDPILGLQTLYEHALHRTGGHPNWGCARPKIKEDRPMMLPQSDGPPSISGRATYTDPRWTGRQGQLVVELAGLFPVSFLYIPCFPEKLYWINSDLFNPMAVLVGLICGCGSLPGAPGPMGVGLAGVPACWQKFL